MAVEPKKQMSKNLATARTKDNNEDKKLKIDQHLDEGR